MVPPPRLSRFGKNRATFPKRHSFALLPCGQESIIGSASLRRVHTPPTTEPIPARKCYCRLFAVRASYFAQKELRHENQVRPHAGRSLLVLGRNSNGTKPAEQVSQAP